MARLIRFYGFSINEISDMTMDLAMDFHLAMQVIIAEERSQLAVDSSVHAMSKKGRDDYFKRLNKNTKLVKTSKDDKIMDTAQAAAHLAKTMGAHGR